MLVEAQKSSSSDANLLQSFHFFGPIVQESSGFRKFAYCTRNHWFVTGFPSSTFFHIFGPAAPKILGFSQEFPLLMQTFPLAHTHIHTMMPAESVEFYRNSDPKQFLSVKLFFTHSKISPPEFIYVGLFFTYSEITAQNKNVCM